MIPVKQTKVSIKRKSGKTVQNGNCFAAVIASMLELPITEVPNVEVFFQFDGMCWHEVMNEFLRLKGYELVTDSRFKCFHPELVDKCSASDIECLVVTSLELKDRYYFVSGLSSRGVRHICIFKNGQMVHDPHPSNDGLETLEVFQTLDKI